MNKSCASPRCSGLDAPRPGARPPSSSRTHSTAEAPSRNGRSRGPSSSDKSVSPRGPNDFFSRYSRPPDEKSIATRGASAPPHGDSASISFDCVSGRSNSARSIAVTSVDLPAPFGP